jgi:hypothetical protein
MKDSSSADHYLPSNKVGGWPPQNDKHDANGRWENRRQYCTNRRKLCARLQYFRYNKDMSNSLLFVASTNLYSFIGDTL